MVKESFWIGLVCGAVSVAMSLWIFSELPDVVPIHWGPKGEPDRFAPKTIGLFIVPLLALVLPMVIAVAARIDPRRNHAEKSWPILRAVTVGTGLFLVIVHGLTLRAMLGSSQTLGPQIILALVGALYVFLGNLLPKLKSTFMAGVRTPWALSSEKNWIKTQRVSGWSMTLIGLLTIPLAFVLPPVTALWVILPLQIAAPIAGVIYSYVIYQQEMSV